MEKDTKALVIACYALTKLEEEYEGIGEETIFNRTIKYVEKFREGEVSCDDMELKALIALVIQSDK
jgi:hypothetical protein